MYYARPRRVVTSYFMRCPRRAVVLRSTILIGMLAAGAVAWQLAEPLAVPSVSTWFSFSTTTGRPTPP